MPASFLWWSFCLPENFLSGYALHAAGINFAGAARGLVEPGTFDIGVGRGIEFFEQETKQFFLIHGIELSDFPFNGGKRSGHARERTKRRNGSQCDKFS